jgi:hypothetical protein
LCLRVGCEHVWFCACFPYVLALGCVNSWLGGLVDSLFGVLLGRSCGLQTCLGFALGSFVVAGVGCDHVWFCACVPYVLALGCVKSWLDGLVDSLFGVLFGQSCGLQKCWCFALGNFVVAGWVVFMHGFVCDFPMCLPWVWCFVCLHTCSFLSCTHAPVGLTCLGLKPGACVQERNEHV